VFCQTFACAVGVLLLLYWSALVYNATCKDNDITDTEYTCKNHESTNERGWVCMLLKFLVNTNHFCRGGFVHMFKSGYIPRRRLHFCPMASEHSDHVGSNSAGFFQNSGKRPNSNCFSSCSSCTGSAGYCLNPMTVQA